MTFPPVPQLSEYYFRVKAAICGVAGCKGRKKVQWEKVEREGKETIIFGVAREESKGDYSSRSQSKERNFP